MTAAAGTFPGLWLGPYPNEARAAFERARARGLTSLRALVVGAIASHKDCWAHRKTIAKRVRCSVRTVQRAITQAQAEGLIGVARAKSKLVDGKRVFEQPPNRDPDRPPITCGWSHRWTVGWGKAGEAVKQAVDAARARFIVRTAVHVRAKAHLTLNVSAPEKTGPRWKVAPSGREWRQMDHDQITRELDDALARAQRAPPD